MNNALLFWCRACHQEFNPHVGESAAQAHKRIWVNSLSGKCDNPQVERKPPRVPQPRVKREKPPLLPDAGEPLVIT